MKFVATLAATAAFAIPSAAAAQQAPMMQEAPAPATSVSDTELSEFVQVALQGQGIQNNAEMTDQEKQMAMLAIIEESDLEVERFAAIAQAISNDPALQQRAQAEVMAQMAQG